MYRYSLFAFVCLSCMACNDHVGEEPPAASDKPEPDGTVVEKLPVNPTGVSGCYMRVMDRDTLAASLQQDGDNITGRFTFDNYQMDGSSGSVAGVRDGDIVRLTYTFQAEGMNSVRLLHLKVEDDGLVLGEGKIASRGDTTFYVNDSEISYPSKNKLSSLHCDSLPAKYK